MKRNQIECRTGVAAGYLLHVVMFVILITVVYVRIRLLNVPLERDEGEFAYMGQLLLKGLPPFTNAYTMKLPGVSVIYALFMLVFGQTAGGIHAGLLIVNLASIGLVYLLAKRLFDRNTALLSCSSYALLSLSSSMYGLFAHATHFVMLFALAGFLLLHYSLENWRQSYLLSAGICFGLAFTMKQHAALLLLFAILYLEWRVWTDASIKTAQRVIGSALFLFGSVAPYLLIVLWIVKSGTFENFWFWTVQYAREYSATPPLAEGWLYFKHTFGAILKEHSPLWFFALVGFVVLAMKKYCCPQRWFVFGFLLCSFLATCPGLIFRGHYFLLLMPVVALFAGVGISFAATCLARVTGGRLSDVIPAVLLAASCIYLLLQGKDNLFIQSPVALSRSTFGAYPFPESLPIANYIKSNTTPADKIAVLGSEPEILFYADRVSATGHIYMYGLMENQPYAERMQAQMISEIEAARPKYIVYVNVNDSWLQLKSSPQLVFNWGGRYLSDLYDTAGVIDIISPYSAIHMWGDSAVQYRPVSKNFVTVFKRKPGV